MENKKEKSDESLALVARLTGICGLGGVCVAPYVLTVNPGVLQASKLSRQGFYAIAGLQGTINGGLGALVGVYSAKYAGFSTEWCKKALIHNTITPQERKQLGRSFLTGAFTALATGALYTWVGVPTAINGVSDAATPEPGVIVGMLASLYGSVNEEVLMRLFLQSSLAAATMFIVGSQRQPNRKFLNKYIRHGAGCVGALAFGAGHLPLARSLYAEHHGGAALPGWITTSVIAINASIGLVASEHYIAHDFLAAIAVHAGADAVLHVIGPVLSQLYGLFEK
eukprot:m.120593 g.120593  ORF g.120593 m.120593 type:complete len:282 (-) comp14368_c0_seq2:4146-4991(-)